ncbi:hypothetical protein NKG05_00795 [Oerskovia sp. M15]
MSVHRRSRGWVLAAAPRSFLLKAAPERHTMYLVYPDGGSTVTMIDDVS